MMKKILTMVFLLLSVGYGSEIKWYDNYDTALESASKNKPIMLMYTRDDCGVCYFVKTKVFTNESVADFISSNFVPLEINLDEEDAIEGLRVFGTPTFYFLNEKGEKFEMIVGGAKAKDFLDRLRKIKKKSLK